MRQVVVINGSPRMDKGDTARVLEPFIQGMIEGGYETALYYASRLKAKPCSCGRMHCWYGEPGVCCIQDEMQALYPRLREAEMLVLATPVYAPLPGDFQNMLNRMCPLIEPLLEYREGRTRAHFRENVAIQRIALVATGGWWERENMGTVERIAREFAEDASVPFAGALLRPHAFAMRADGELTQAGEAVLEAVRQAGHELATQGVMRPETLEAVERPLITQEALQQRYNAILV